MRRRLVGLVVLLGLFATCQAQVTPAPALDPDSDLPQGHWVYDAVIDLEHLGFDTGFPPQTIQGKAARTRREMARAVSNIAGEGGRLAGVGWPYHPSGRDRSYGPMALTKLVQEFQPELSAMYPGPHPLHPTIDAFATLWRDGRPQGVTVPLLPYLMRYDSAARAEGARRAAEEWGRGEVVLEYQDLPETDASFPHAIPLRRVNGDLSDNALRERVAGHNAEVWGRAASRQVPDAKLAWLSTILHLQKTWWSAGQPAGQLSVKHPAMQLPHSEARVVLLARGEVTRAEEDLFERRCHVYDGHRLPAQTLVIERPGGRVLADVLELGLASGGLQIRPGPAGSGVILIRSRDASDRAMPYRYYALDVRTGMALNAAAGAG
jgi:hypothetical protein